MGAPTRKEALVGALIAPQGIEVGSWTWPYKRPRGTRAVQVERIDGQYLHLSDGSAIHWTNFRAAGANEVAS